MTTTPRPRVALLLSAVSFEPFFVDVLGVDAARFVEEYRNDFAWEYRAALWDAGYDLLIYVATNTASGIHTATDGATVRFLRRPAIWRITIDCLRPARAWSRSRFLLQQGEGWSLGGQLAQAAQEDQIEALLVQEFWSGRFVALAAREDLPPIIAQSQGGRHRGEPLPALRRAAERATLTVQDDAAAEVTERLLGTKPHVVPNAVDTDFFTTPTVAVPLKRGVGILAVGRLNDEQKRFSVALHALARLPSPYRLTIAGTGPDERALRVLARELGISHRCDFVGFVGSREEIRDLYWEHDVFVMPSAREGLPMVVLEAMASGLPTVLTDIAGHAAIKRALPSAFWVQPDDVAGLASALAYAADLRGDARERHVDAQRRVVEHHFSRRRLGRNISQLIRQSRRL